jgi:ABC-type oligopeptide transport system ATPase subunit
MWYMFRGQVNLRVVEYMSDRLAVMYRGKAMELAGVGEIYERPRYPSAEALRKRHEQNSRREMHAEKRDRQASRTGKTNQGNR